ERIVKIIMEKREDMAKETGIQLDNYSVLTQIKRINVVLHIGAKKYYDKQLNSTIKKIESFTKLFIVPCFVIFLLIGIYKNWFKIARLYRQYPVIRVLLILFGLLFCGTTVMFNAEHRINDNYATWGLSFWSTLMNWINFGSKEPVTVAGRINSTIMTILGLGGISWITSEVLHMIITRRTNPGGKRMKDHFIIINWNEKGNMLVNNIKLMQSEIGSHAEIVVVSQTAENRKNDYEIVQDDPLAEDIVDRTNMKNARSVIVMSKENIPSAEADTQNILIILNLAKQLKGISKDKQPHIVLEISSPDKVHLLSEGDLDVEVVSTKTIAGDLLVQVAANPGLTEVYMDLLTNAKGSSEIYSIKLSSNWYGLSFEDIFNTCAKMRAQNTDILPLAIKRGLKTIVNPTKNDIGKIEEGDILFAICDNLQLLYKLNTIKYKI
ncbi:MAG: NAD-binding protein, partial [Paludibacter sp.]